MTAYFLTPGLRRSQGAQLSPNPWAHSQGLSVDAAPLSFFGADVSLSGLAPTLDIESAPVAFVGADISLDLTGGTVLTIESSAWALIGADVTLNLLPNIAIDPSPLTFAGQDIQLNPIEALPNNPISGGSRSTVR